MEQNNEILYCAQGEVEIGKVLPHPHEMESRQESQFGVL